MSRRGAIVLAADQYSVAISRANLPSAMTARFSSIPIATTRHRLPAEKICDYARPEKIAKKHSVIIVACQREIQGGLFQTSMEAIQKRLQDYLRSVTNSNLTLGGSRRDMERQLAANDETVRNPRLTLGDLGRSSETGRLVAALKPLSATGRSATFVCPHWGNYVATFTSIAFQLPDESRFIAFRGDDWGESEGLFWKYLNQLSRREVSIYHTDQRRILASIVKEMRNGTHLFVLFDLFRKYGETAPIRFYDAELHVTIGWAKLCYLAQSVVVSVGPASLQRPDILILDVIDPRNSSTQEHFVGECMRALSRSLEILVHENPGYWFMWEHLDKYGRQ